jgi:hypothetical protein
MLLPFLITRDLNRLSTVHLPFLYKKKEKKKKDYLISFEDSPWPA